MEKEKKQKNGKPKQVGNGNGSLYFSEKLKKWIYQYVEPDGKRQTITQRKNESYTTFNKRVTEVKGKLDNGTYIKKCNDTVYMIAKRYIEQKYRDGITEAISYKRNLETLNQLNITCKNFINKPIAKVVVEDIEDAKILIREYSKSCISKQWCLLKKVFNIAISRRKLNYNIMDDANLVKPISLKPTEKKEALSVEEEKKFRRILNNEERYHKYRNIVLMQLDTGMRIGETLSRSFNDIVEEIKNNKFQKYLYVWNTLTKDENEKIIIGKHTKIYNKSTHIDKGKRYIPLNDEVLEIISQIEKYKLKNIYNLLFWDYDKNTFISNGEINSWLDRINCKYHISKNKLSTHILRHTKITRLQEAGVAMPVIQYLVGQVEGSSVTDDIYTSVSLDFVHNELKKIN